VNPPSAVRQLRPASLRVAKERPVPEIPPYMHEVYYWAYVSPRNVELLDRPIVPRVLLFLNDRRLMRALIEEISEGQKVLLPAHVYGNLCPYLADRIGPSGILHVSDVTPIQVAHAHRKVTGRPWVRVWQEDAATTGDGVYDVVASFFLLHEVPDGKKRQVLDNLLDHVAPGGKAVLIDYHKPHWAHPVRPILSFVCRTLEPFAHAVWDHDLSAFASAPEDFTWTKTTYFGGVYQKVIVTRR
jgi:SAM-dependent methyltransferase